MDSVTEYVRICDVMFIGDAERKLMWNVVSTTDCLVLCWRMRRFHWNATFGKLLQ